MPSQFIDNFTHSLTASSPALSSTLELSAESPTEGSNEQVSTIKRTLHTLLVSFPQPLNAQQLKDAISVLSELESESGSFSVKAADAEEDALKNAVVGKITVGLYAEVMDLYLSQATEVETEAEWWRDIERSRLNAAWYLLQTTPVRLCNIAETVIAAVRSQNLPLSLSTFASSSLARLFPTSPTSPFRPSVLTTAFFPHLSKTSLAVTALLYPPVTSLPASAPFTERTTGTLSYYYTLITSCITHPLSLTRQECRSNRRALENIRDERAEVLGKVSQMRNDLSKILTDPSYAFSSMTEFLPKIQYFIQILDCKAAVDAEVKYSSPVQALAHLSNETLPMLVQSHRRTLGNNRLLRPSTLVLAWPKILLLPPLTLIACRSLYASRASLEEVVKDAVTTLKGFVRGWLLEPLRDVLKTVRSGSGDEEGVLVRREGVMADLDSLERMTLSLAKDELKYSDEQLVALSRQIRLGDMTPVMQVYEKDIRRPLKSAVAGTLLRNVFIQVQKAKVDIDQALTGIDRLLKSQELTFAFVGVAPALAVVYLACGALTHIWTGGRGRGRYGGLHRRRGVWDSMRRIERLLIPINQQEVEDLTSGLLLLSLARLRSYATDHLPANSRLRDGFLEDLDELEKPELRRDAKLEVVHRMWRCWGASLGWDGCGAYH
ncbi:NCA2-domain-containing protein [Macrolepiota fuliginosa MF-IS2]|uniref:NCA2-domain-containing protein n=1 Tax=Macrolepiota fuliginosa MF-IS2 TaxID=1400762 RepID=A0A9P6C5X9_9AGAR|nr:NCA2-domain-containing protein [Macrolepiota fuliginosa MF-IS2]